MDRAEPSNSCFGNNVMEWGLVLTEEVASKQNLFINNLRGRESSSGAREQGQSSNWEKD